MATPWPITHKLELYFISTRIFSFITVTRLSKFETDTLVLFNLPLVSGFVKGLNDVFYGIFKPFCTGSKRRSHITFSFHVSFASFYLEYFHSFSLSSIKH